MGICQSCLDDLRPPARHSAYFEPLAFDGPTNTHLMCAASESHGPDSFVSRVVPQGDNLTLMIGLEEIIGLSLKTPEGDKKKNLSLNELGIAIGKLEKNPVMIGRIEHQIHLLSQYQVGGEKVLRELVANAIDAHFTEAPVPVNGGLKQKKVEIKITKSAIEVRDFGIGMNLGDVIYFLLTPTSSKNVSLMSSEKATSGVTGRFGMGFFSMLSYLENDGDSIEILTKKENQKLLKIKIFRDHSEHPNRTKLSSRLKVSIEDGERFNPSFLTGTNIIVRSKKIESKSISETIELLKQDFQFNDKLNIKVNLETINEEILSEKKIMINLPEKGRIILPFIEGKPQTPQKSSQGKLTLTINGVLIKEYLYEGVNIFPHLVLELPPQTTLTSDRNTLNFKDEFLLKFLAQSLLMLGADPDRGATFFNSLRVLFGDVENIGRLFSQMKNVFSTPLMPAHKSLQHLKKIKGTKVQLLHPDYLAQLNWVIPETELKLEEYQNISSLPVILKGEFDSEQKNLLEIVDENYLPKVFIVTKNNIDTTSIDLPILLNQIQRDKNHLLRLNPQNWFQLMRLTKSDSALTLKSDHSSGSQSRREEEPVGFDAEILWRDNFGCFPKYFEAQSVEDKDTREIYDLTKDFCGEINQEIKLISPMENFSFKMCWDWVVFQINRDLKNKGESLRSYCRGSGRDFKGNLKSRLNLDKDLAKKSLPLFKQFSYLLQYLPYADSGVMRKSSPADIRESYDDFLWGLISFMNKNHEPEIFLKSMIKLTQILGFINEENFSRFWNHLKSLPSDLPVSTFLNNVETNLLKFVDPQKENMLLSYSPLESMMIFDFVLKFILKFPQREFPPLSIWKGVVPFFKWIHKDSFLEKYTYPIDRLTFSPMNISNLYFFNLILDFFTEAKLNLFSEIIDQDKIKKDQFVKLGRFYSLIFELRSLRIIESDWDIFSEHLNQYVLKLFDKIIQNKVDQKFFELMDININLISDFHHKEFKSQATQPDFMGQLKFSSSGKVTFNEFKKILTSPKYFNVDTAPFIVEFFFQDLVAPQLLGQPFISERYQALESTFEPIQKNKRVQSIMGRDELLIQREYFLSIRQNPQPLSWVKEIFKNSAEAAAQNIDIDVMTDKSNRIMIKITDDGKGVSFENSHFFYIPKLTSKSPQGEIATGGDINFGWGFFTLFNFFNEVAVITSVDGVQSTFIHLKMVPGTNEILISEVKQNHSPIRRGTEIWGLKYQENSLHDFSDLYLQFLVSSPKLTKLGIKVKYNKKIMELEDLNPLLPENLILRGEISERESHQQHKGNVEFFKTPREGLYFKGQMLTANLEKYLSGVSKPLRDIYQGLPGPFKLALNIEGPLKQNMGRTDFIHHSQWSADLNRLMLMALEKLLLNYLLLDPLKMISRYDFFYDFEIQHRQLKTNFNELDSKEKILSYLSTKTLSFNATEEHLSLVDLKNLIFIQLKSQNIVGANGKYLEPFNRKIDFSNLAEKHPHLVNIIKVFENEISKYLKIQESQNAQMYFSSHDDHLAAPTDFTLEKIIEIYFSSEKHPEKIHLREFYEWVKSELNMIPQEKDKIEVKFYQSADGSDAHARQGGSSISFNILGQSFKNFKEMKKLLMEVPHSLEGKILRMKLLGIITHELTHLDETPGQQTHNETFFQNQAIKMEAFLPRL
jgi:hypothetical protein